MVQIIPAVLAISEQQYQEDINKLTASKSLSEGWVHIDFADNIFVRNKTIEPETIQKFPTNFRKEAHLMVAHPKEWIEKLAKAGFKRVIFHIEVEDDIDESIEIIKSKGLEVGLAIKNETPIEKLEPFIDKINRGTVRLRRINRGTVLLRKIDIILVMTVIPGFQGQPFIPEALEKVRKIKSQNWPVRVGVDGHVNADNAKEIIRSGVDFMVVGSYLLTGNVGENLESIREAING